MSGDTTLPPMALGFAAPSAQTREGLALLAGNAELAALLDLLPNALVLVDPDDTIRVFNTSAESLFGCRRANVLGRTFESLRRDTLLDLETFLDNVARGQRTGAVHARHGGGQFTGSRLPVAVGDAAKPWTLYHFSPLYESGAPRTVRRPRDSLPSLTLPPALKEAARHAAVALGRRLSVLLEGETGAGKSALGRFIHEQSPRAGGPFVHVNCGSIPETLFESELFGYERGAFTGALHGGKRGHIERAAGGTLFLDEVGEVPLACQAKLLRFLEDGSLQPVGGQPGRRIDVAVVCATNRDLRAMVAAGSFRRDLYFRIASFCVTVPPLRGSSLLPQLITQQLASLNAEREVPLVLAPETLGLLLAHPYEGNVRELRNLLEHASIVAGRVAEPQHLPDYVLRAHEAPPGGGAGLRAQVRAFERRLIAQTLAQGASKREAARRLGIDVATLIRKARED